MKQLLFVGLLALAIASHAQVNKPTFNSNGTLNKTAGIGITQKLGAEVPLDITFKDETGAPVRLSQYFGRRPVLLNLIFYKCPGMCSLELEGLVSSFAKMSYVRSGQAPGAAHTLIGSDVDVVTVSIDPNEGPDLAAAKRKTVLENFDYPSVKTGWHFLTGDLENLNRLVSAVGFEYTYNPDSKAISHPAGIVLLSPTGKVTQYFYGTGYPEKPLHDAIALAAANTVGPKADVILLGCLSHDAMTGKYSVNVERTTQVLGALTVFILAFSIWRMGHKRAVPPGDQGGESQHG
jgi:protein SCO1/2